VYLKLLLLSDPFQKVQVEECFKEMICGMKYDLLGIFQFLEMVGFYFDDHYFYVC